MLKRKFGRTGHFSTIAILGGFVLSQATHNETDYIMEQVLRAEINHIDIAPSYGHAEARLGPWMKKTNTRDQFYLGCKTMERSYKGALDELHESLERLGTTYFDLYQIHAITTMQELDEVTQSGGALEAIIEARETGLTKHIGITGHGVDAPEIFIEALNRFEFDSILFPINFIQYYDQRFRTSADRLIAICREKEVGTMAIKALSCGPWGDMPPTHITWYKPFTDPQKIQKAIDFVLSQDVTGICTAGDPGLLPLVIEACELFSPMSLIEQEKLVATSNEYAPLFT